MAAPSCLNCIYMVLQLYYLSTVTDRTQVSLGRGTVLQLTTVFCNKHHILKQHSGRSQENICVEPEIQMY